MWQCFAQPAALFLALPDLRTIATSRTQHSQLTTHPGPRTMASMSGETSAASASNLIEARIAELSDWRGETLAQVRQLILGTDPDITEDLKWRGVPVWSHHGILCTGETYKQTVKLTFAKGAALPDPAQLFNASLDGNTRRAIDLHQRDALNQAAFQDLIRAAISLNLQSKAKRRAKS